MVSDQKQPYPGHQMPKQTIVFPSIKKKEITVKKACIIRKFFVNMLDGDQKEYVWNFDKDVGIVK